MSPLNIDVLDPVTKAVKSHGVLNPGEPMRAFTMHPLELKQNILYRCEKDDQSSAVYRVPEGVYVRPGTPSEELPACVERVATLSKGMSLELPVSLEGLKRIRHEAVVRFSHVERG